MVRIAVCDDNPPVAEQIRQIWETEVEMDGFLDIPVRQLSLGQGMREEMAAAMLHSPEILFLDEPTIGLDIDAKKRSGNLFWISIKEWK